MSAPDTAAEEHRRFADALIGRADDNAGSPGGLVYAVISVTEALLALESTFRDQTWEADRAEIFRIASEAVAVDSKMPDSEHYERALVALYKIIEVTE